MSIAVLLDGYVARVLGDGMFTYFGYPTAHETTVSVQAVQRWRYWMP